MEVDDRDDGKDGAEVREIVDEQGIDGDSTGA